MRPRIAPLVLAIGVSLGTNLHAQETDPVGVAAVSSAQSMQAQVDRLEARLEQQQREIQSLRAQVEFLELGVRGRGLTEPDTAIAQTQPAEGQGTTEAIAPTAPAQDPAAPVQQIGQAQQEDETERKEREKALVVQQHAPLFERRFTLDMGYSHSYYDRRQLALSGFLALDAIFLGTINLDQTKATVHTLDFTGRYGLSDRLNLEVNVPYLYRDSRFVSGGAGGASTSISEVRKKDSGLGDASAAVYYQLVKESARWPDVVASLRVRGPSGRDPFGIKLILPDDDNNNLNVPDELPTGTGIWSGQLGVSVLRTYDPVILFGGLNYLFNKSATFDDISPVLGQVQPAKVKVGDAVQLSGGLAIALNDRSGVSFSVATTMGATTRTKPADGGVYDRIPGSSYNTASFNIGGTYVLPESGWTMSGQLATGLTPDAPNFVFSLRASHSF